MYSLTFILPILGVKMQALNLDVQALNAQAQGRFNFAGLSAQDIEREVEFANRKFKLIGERICWHIKIQQEARQNCLKY